MPRVPARQFRITDADLDLIDRIGAHIGEPTRAGVIRQAVYKLARSLGIPRQEPAAKKSEKKPR